MPKTALIVDDDPHVRRSLNTWLKRAGWSCETHTCGAGAVDAALKLTPQVIFMDVLLGDADGRRLCSAMRAEAGLSAVPIILISGSKIDRTDQVVGLRSGADDYVLKPLSEDYLLAKLDAVLLRYRAPKESSEALQYLGLTIDPTARTVLDRGREVALTRKEFDLLNAFLRQRGRVLTPASLLENVWGYEPGGYDDPRTVQVHVSRLKRKLGPKFSKTLTNVIGVGYRLG